MSKPLAPVPPMGWNISDELIRTTADFIADSGLKDGEGRFMVIVHV